MVMSHITVPAETFFSHIGSSGMICRMIGQTIMFSQVGFPTINRHPRPDPVPMFVRYPRHRLRSATPASIWAMGFHLRHRPRSALGLSGKQNTVDRCDDDKFRRETAQIERINSINL
jgi:hypothetical protein